MAKFPYTNTHELNLDWILQIVRDFQAKYTNFDETVQAALEQIESAKDGSLSDITAALETAITAINAAVAAELATARTTLNGDLANAEQVIQFDRDTATAEITSTKTAALTALSDSLATALAAITSGEQAATARINALYNTLPQDSTDILGQLAIINGILNGDSVQTLTWVQGRYEDNSLTITSTPYFVSSQVLGGAAGRRLIINCQTGYIITEVGYWHTVNSSLVHGGFFPLSDSFDNILPYDTEYFSIQIAKSDYTSIQPSDITGNVSVEWPVAAIEDPLNIAPVEVSLTASQAHAKGTLLIYDGKLYRATANIDAGDTITLSGSGANVQQTQVSTELSTLSRVDDSVKNALADSGVDILKAVSIFQDYITDSLTCTYNPATGEYTLNGTTVTGIYNFWNLVDLPVPGAFIKTGEEYLFDFTSNNGNFWVECFQMAAGSIISSHTITDRAFITILSNTDELIVRLKASYTGMTYNNATLKVQMHNVNNYGFFSPHGDSIANNTDLNTINNNGIYIIDSSRSYTHSPFPSGFSGVMYQFTNGRVKHQFAFGFGTNQYSYTRTGLRDNWTDWVPIGLQERVNTTIPSDVNTMTTPAYDGYYIVSDSQSVSNLPCPLPCFFFSFTVSDRQTFQACFNWDATKCFIRRRHDTTWTAWAQIGAADAGAYLAPTGDSTDRTSEIVSILNTYGACRLGKGDYYISNLDMPAFTSIQGLGIQSRMILSGSSDGYAVKMATNCTISNVHVSGSTSDIALSSTVGGRHGILWQGNYTQAQTAPYLSMISNVWLSRFTGGAITCTDTGYGTANNLEVCNAYIWDCNAGLNIAYWSEFHKFTNVRANWCYYGCINNGGNNVFTNCDFSGCTMAFLMDNTNNQSPNNSHGSCVGCVFNHSGSNAGIGVKIINCHNGFIFDGCQIFFSQIYIDDSSGIVFSNCNVGSSNCDVYIKDGGTVLFANNMYGSAPDASTWQVTKINNNNVHFVNCYVKASGEIVNG